MDLVVRSGTVVTETATVQADVGVADGVIAAIGPGLESGKEEIDARGLLVLPGGVDAHVHLNSRWPPFDEERRPVDDFLHGTRAAAAGGVTTVCDFVYQLDGQSLEASIEEIGAEAAKNACIDVALHVVIELVEADLPKRIDKLVESGYPSFKFYTNSSDFVHNGAAYLEVMAAIAEAGGLAMFHCEDEAIDDYCSQRLLRAGQRSVSLYPESKPLEVELAASERVLRMAAVTGVPTYLVHLSLASALEEALAARAQGQVVYVETRPLYLYLTEERFAQDDREAAKYVGTPPLRRPDDRERLWGGLTSNEIDVVATDHVGFAMADKHRCGDCFDDVPRGVANLETLIPMLFSEGVLKRRITLEHMVRLVATNPARIFKLASKGVLAVGADADICVLDPEKTQTLPLRPGHSASDFDVYAGYEVTGWPRYTISRGEVVFAEGEVVASKHELNE